VILYITAGTNYKGINAHPDYLDHSGAYLGRTIAQLNAARQQSEGALFERHMKDFRALYERTSLSVDLPAATGGEHDTPELVAQAKQGDIAPDLLADYFQLGRYLLISSSREGDLAANLQGIWTVNFKDDNQGGRWNYYTPWNGDYHANVNVQMNYWPAYTANLAECAGPMYDLIRAMSVPGEKTARVQHGASGWTTHTINNVWGFTSPGWEASWGHFPMAGPWMATHIWTGYAHTLDKDFLTENWPALKGSAQFVLDWLVKDKDGLYVSGPSESPENKFRLPDGSIGYFCMGPSMDQELAAQLLTETLRAAKVLGIEDDFTKQCAAVLPKIRPVGIGPDGRLLEWTEPYDEPEPGHRHTSHLFGVYPGSTIRPETTPALAEAAKKSLDYRAAHGGGYTGWSRAMMMGEWARLKDGEKAYENLKALLRDSTLPNLFDSCPPFQIDGNFGATAGIIEMLMQSAYNEDGTVTLELLPALPRAWPAGKLRGVCAEGCVTVDVKWTGGAFEEACLAAPRDTTVKLRVQGQSTTLALKADEPILVDSELATRPAPLEESEDE
jgi:alpha-L-fucosidase 2